MAVHHQQRPVKFTPFRGLWNCIRNRGNERIGILIYPRIASHSLSTALGAMQSHYFNGSYVDRVVCLTRHPFARVESLWSLHNSDLPPVIPGLAKPCSFAEFVDAYVNYDHTQRKANKHWVSQTVGLNGMPLDKFWRLEDDFWPDFSDWMGIQVDFPHLHKSDPRPPFDESLQTALRKHLADDFELFGWA